VIRLIFLRWVLVPTILLIFFCDLSASGYCDECLAAFMGITSNAIDSDGISLKLLLPFIIDHVLHVFNHATTCSVFPTMWKSVIIRPVVASPSCPSDFRPITIVSVLSKGFERLINGQILAHAHVDRSGLLSEFQSGFRCGHSTTTASLGLLRI
jgi:hypothetical protein